MTWLKRITIGLVAILFLLIVVGAILPQPREANEQRPKQPYRVEDGVLGKLVTFPSARGSEPASITITCSDAGEIDDFMVHLDPAPSSPPPLRGVFGEFSFSQEPRTRIELGYSTDGIWLTREGQAGNVRQIARRLAGGEQLSFKLAAPYGSGKTIVWDGPPSFSVPGCRR